MKLSEILKYNGALFLTGLFFVFISATTAGLLLLGSNLGIPLFVWSGCSMFLGCAAGLYAVKDYRGRAEFVPDYFIMLLPVTALVVVFSSLYSELQALHPWHALIWGFSVGICFGMLQAVNPDSRYKGFPTFTLGAVVGGVLSMPVLSGKWHLSDVYAISGCVVALMPLICFSGKLKSRKTLAVSIVLGLGICAAIVHEAWRYRNVEQDTAILQEEMLRREARSVPREVEITPWLPVLLQPGAVNLKILISEPSQAAVSRQLSRLPFVAAVVRTNIDRVHRYNEPFSWNSGLRRLLTSAIADQYLSGVPLNTGFHLLLIIPGSPAGLGDARLKTMEFYRIAASFLGPNGMLATTARSAKEAAAIGKTMRTAFSSVAFFPGRNQREILVVGAPFPLCVDYNELDRRAVMRFEHLGFCRGMMTVFLPPVQQYGVTNAVTGLLPSSRLNTDLQPGVISHAAARLLNNHHRTVLLLFAVMPFYLLVRFFSSRRITRRIAFSSLENGIYSGGMMAAVWIIFYGVEGRLFLYLGWLSAVFLLGAACAYGLNLQNRMIRLLIFIGSALLPATILLYDHILFQEYYLVIATIYMFLAGFSAGIASAMFASRLPDGVYQSYLHWIIAGIPVGGLISWFLLAMSSGGLWWWAGLLLLLRLPLIFRRLK